MKRGYSQRIYEAVANGDMSKIGVRLGAVCIDAEIPVQIVAGWFKVSRQAVYFWFSGETELADRNRERAVEIIDVLIAALKDEQLPKANLTEAIEVVKTYREKLKCVQNTPT